MFLQSNEANDERTAGHFSFARRLTVVNDEIYEQSFDIHRKVVDDVLNESELDDAENDETNAEDDVRDNRNDD